MMRSFWVPAAAALLALAACDGNPTVVEEDVATVQVMPDERVLAVGETLQLDAVVRDESGEEPSAERMGALAWSSDNTGVATVSASGLVTGAAAGTANIRAELEGVTGTIRVTVAPAPAATCSAAALRQLAVGAGLTLGGVQASTVCLEGGAAGQEYVAVPFHAGELNAGLFTARLTGQGIIPVGPGSASVAPAFSLAGGRQPDEAFHERLRERATGELAPHVGTAMRAGRRRAEGMGPSLVLNLRNPTVGQQVQVNTALASCEGASNRNARVAAVGQRSVVLADLNNPAGGLTDAEYASFAAGFDTLVYPVITQTFGTPGDVDGNEKVVIFYTSAVNELTPQGSSAYVGGYFHPRDLFPTQDQDGLAACATSNFAEMFYMLVPDPQGTVNNNVFPRELILQTSLSTIAHEFQHLINASRRLYVVNTTHWSEETWLNEGLSHIAEEVLFYHTSGMAARQNLGADQIQPNPRALAAFRTYMDQNIRRYQRYLEDAEGQSPYDATEGDDNDLATRGASWAFLRYAADRRTPGTETQLWKDLVEGSVTGFANLQQALGGDPRPMIRDWTASVFADDVVTGLETRFAQPSWRFRSFFSTWPLQTRSLATGAVNVALKSGSGAFVRFGVAPGQTGLFAARRSSGDPLPSQMYVTIIRTK